MKTNYITIVLVTIASLFTYSSCTKFLDVQPEDKVLETELFSSQRGIQSVLNGLYINLAGNNLYGDNLTLSTVEILAQRYNIPSTHSLTKIATYAYRDNPTIGRMETIWSNAYSSILNINTFIENLDKYKGALDPETENIFRGEAIAMRAFLHFDLLRLYGPRYSTVDSTKQSLPYYVSSQNTINPLLAANDFLDNVLSDLSTAENLLQNDEVVTTGVNPRTPTGSTDFLKTDRNYRLNYYAVKGLKARVFLYRGNKVDALKYAKEIITVASKFPWTTTTNALSEKQNPDRVFSTEMLFGVMSTQLYNRYTSLFDPALTDASILAPITARLNTVYENNENDYRFNLNWQVPTTGLKSYKTFYKYADIVDKDRVFRFTIPLLKVSELYYIAAESEPVAADGIAHLNIVRANRGLLPLASTVNINTELQKEHQKEFFGEGQLFFYYKRRNVTSIPNGSASSGNVRVNYDVPLPESESIYR
ncbi:hypothetical protein FAZ19_19215 [Sphingobacterium alkalisoli]|uniref:SusD-like N-terminal domain-containing protein n=1 Tax=Sphingobacterium alkalisoli TaxID=1874115 RepID=A0A4U0GVK3_9SPHI|nr:RagB/SusD family nutrient uptake outer membrane protein [Sphingobacterium alkalisoli]TJY62604.1 hypothetical protein FAZ19_19215 [Sphingobacterium alkalisoli]GGH27732.1 hypothetical protein GCM10011418_37850 [Sphingobacterium alkalisoli]